ncbi:hypothetical protein DL95DRAFT_469709 [Leptodontidium sp. 2 PMI_412]|nr:hypothetical protein DL95DRAFT_469709 [Leptodontidium sp. 2 PMI_412]
MEMRELHDTQELEHLAPAAEGNGQFEQAQARQVQGQEAKRHLVQVHQAKIHKDITKSKVQHLPATLNVRREYGLANVKEESSDDLTSKKREWRISTWAYGAIPSQPSSVRQYLTLNHVSPRRSLIRFLAPSLLSIERKRVACYHDDAHQSVLNGKNNEASRWKHSSNLPTLLPVESVESIYPQIKSHIVKDQHNGPSIRDSSPGGESSNTPSAQAPGSRTMGLQPRPRVSFPSAQGIVGASA